MEMFSLDEVWLKTTLAMPTRIVGWLNVVVARRARR